MPSRNELGDRRVIVIDTPPTPNGSLHVGHLAGPFIAADVHARYLRATGRGVLYSSGTDESQTYVLASARKLGVAPEELARRSWTGIRDTLETMGMSVDGFAPYDDGYRATVLKFVQELHAAGKFELRTVRLPYSEKTGEFLVEGLVCGDCPICLSESRGGLCETCGHPNNFDELIGARSTVDPTDQLTTREAEILVLPMEDYRDRLTTYYAEKLPYLRPHMAQLVRELLDRPLADFPITYPLGWGIEAPFPETPGQVINAWVEGIPAVMYTTDHAARQLGEETAASDELWRTDRDHELVYFIGFDNIWFWGLTHLALIMAHEGRYIVPDAMIVNEFYELENEKFSTSRGHVLYAEDLLKEVPRDLVRFYLALANPENQRTNFSRVALDKVTGERLVQPWERLRSRLDEAARTVGGTTLPVSDRARRHAAIMLERFAACYELEGYSLTRAADLICVQLERLARWTEELDLGCRQPDRTALGDLYLEVRALIACASPILIDLAEAAALAGGFDGSLGFETFALSEVKPFALPPLGTTTAQAG
ncbi:MULTISPECIES: class I tRNA ligase family protein [unclassified Streptomyces]|uniref:class I tRNA ligase family protein n=1 Tax=unclassified Streptomyces TaxID=2593676 RepID=UPI00036C118B|nr:MULTISPECIES: class I tRNA ligase family protein [unclassified Streptomyces]MYT33728.1 class I tRNA ligase family protein [Streptomyces sp. SID8354]